MKGNCEAHCDMRSLVLITIVGFFASWWSLTAEAAIALQRVTTPEGLKIFVLRGNFDQRDDARQFAQIAAEFKPDFISFDSAGGNVHSAIQYGETIRTLGLRTLQFRATQCMSACSLAFLGGIERFAEPGSIGVHKSSFSDYGVLDSESAVSAIQQSTAEVVGYMVRMGADPGLLQLSLSIESTDIRFLTGSEMMRYKVTTGAINERLFAARRPQIDQLPDEPSIGQPDAEKEARSFMERYLATWSKPNSVALSFMEHAYADQVNFYGKVVAKSAVLKDKINFARRWPKRAYDIQHETEVVSCSQKCVISGNVNWYAHSDQRGKTSAGVAEYTIVWSPATNQIYAENGKVLANDKHAVAPTVLLQHWENENLNCRGGSGDDPKTLVACERRNSISLKLENVGWCYGRKGEFDYQMQWHQCDATSIRLRN